MNIFTERSVPEIGTILTEEQFLYVNRLFNSYGLEIDGVHQDINNEDTLNQLVGRVKFAVANINLYDDENPRKSGSFELGDETIKTLIQSYGELQTTAEVHEDLDIHTNTTVTIPDHYKTEDDILSLGLETLEEIGYENQSFYADDCDWREVEVHSVHTTLLMHLPRPQFFAETNQLDAVA